MCSGSDTADYADTTAAVIVNLTSGAVSSGHTQNDSTPCPSAVNVICILRDAAQTLSKSPTTH